MRAGRFLRFLAAGGLAAGVNFGSRIALDMAFPYVASIVLAYLLGMTTAFLLNRAFVFQDTSGTVGRQASWFVVVNAAAVLQTIAISLLLARIVFPAVGMTYAPETIAHAVGIIVPVFTSYLGHKHFSFR